MDTINISMAGGYWVLCHFSVTNEVQAFLICQYKNYRNDRNEHNDIQYNKCRNLLAKTAASKSASLPNFKWCTMPLNKIVLQSNVFIRDIIMIFSHFFSTQEHMNFQILCNYAKVEPPPQLPSEVFITIYIIQSPTITVVNFQFTCHINTHLHI